MRKAISLLAWIYLALSLLALFVFLVGIFGLFGAERDPLSALFLIVLGQPWVRWVSYLPEGLWPWAGAATPFINSALLFFFASRLAR